ncbi:hypothetical protein ACFQY4_11960 [Catellatospora bangladeshensis]|uniref:hypothetical protein n=1 Tax=Catellatospora bangladeshensis TaxID=310355 RepID=UPI003623E778
MNVRTAVAMLCGPAAIAIGVVLHPATGDQGVPAPAEAAGQTWTVGADLPPAATRPPPTSAATATGRSPGPGRPGPRSSPVIWSAAAAPR